MSSNLKIFGTGISKYKTATECRIHVEEDVMIRQSSKQFVFNIQPQTKPRMTIRDKWKQRPVVVKYRAYKDQLNLMAKLKGFELPEDGMGFVFIFEMPKSWSKKKREEMDGKPHKQTPDLDNIIKGFWDALASEDKHLWKVSAIKRWGREGAIIIQTI